MKWLKNNTDEQSLHFHLAKLRDKRREVPLPVSFSTIVDNNKSRDVQINDTAKTPSAPANHNIATTCNHCKSTHHSTIEHANDEKRLNDVLWESLVTAEDIEKTKDIISQLLEKVSGVAI